MAQTAIVECPHCGGLLLAPMDKKTRTCPFCNTRLDLLKIKRLGKAENAMAASEMLRKIKAERQDNAHSPDRKGKNKQY